VTKNSASALARHGWAGGGGVHTRLLLGKNLVNKKGKISVNYPRFSKKRVRALTS
jgi:hypothetical protein